MKNDKQKPTGNWFKRVMALFNLGINREGEADDKKAVEIKLEEHDCFLRGVELYNSKRYEEAIAYFDKVLERKPDFYEAWNFRGFILKRLECYEEAIANYDKALEIKPDYDLAWCHRGYALHDLGRAEEAIAAFNKALEINPADHGYWETRGNFLKALGRTEEAIASWEKVVALKPGNNYLAWFNRGNALKNLGRYEEAITAYKKAVKIEPEDHVSCFFIARCYALLGNIDLAIKNLPEQYRQIAQTDSDFARIREDSRFQMLIQGK